MLSVYRSMYTVVLDKQAVVEDDFVEVGDVTDASEWAVTV